MSNLIALNVVNSQLLEAGLTPHTRMDIEGGTIGADSSCDWILRDRLGAIGHVYGRVSWLDEHFCIEDLCGRVLMNGATIPLGKGRKARLNDNDTLSIGPYTVRVALLDAEETSGSVSGRLSEWFKSGVSSLIAHEGKSSDREEGNDDASGVLDDPLQALSASANQHSSSMVDTDGKCRNFTEVEAALAKKLNIQHNGYTAQADTDFDTGSAINPSQRMEKGSFMDETTLDLLESELHVTDGAPEVSHLATGPMLRGLGVNLDEAGDTGRQQALAVEMGAALQSAIRGLLGLHSEVQASRYDLINKNLQPIEDNPLRLGLSYEETVRTLFDDRKSPVHLSPAAAIEESLHSIEHHNDAVQYAITEALNYILDAFSPETLLKRFSQYRKVSDAAVKPRDNWAWDMYENYYRELASTRQQGFRKLFWEVFEQAYDRKLRELQREI
ncbi:Uncharacterized protein ImpI/VasC [Marinobacterium lacunae]|uniref:Uncharacterized protein ImpI/VasC n=1 Tax=Marinobacterium lacunae TaxID=1232683 RepID=A0A081G3B6_9GAMM|nr:type VI secretion system-associated FHA domain protein TagH [Marinobacterium lacunae]KEA65271.1 Uncharacterized protein ImpI/VasC [Marinobacterium lacunae]